MDVAKTELKKKLPIILYQLCGIFFGGESKKNIRKVVWETSKKNIVKCEIDIGLPPKNGYLETSNVLCILDECGD